MKAKVLLIGSVAILGIGAVTHLTGHAPKCPLRSVMRASKPEVKKETVTIKDQQKKKVDPAGVAMLNPLEK